MSSYLSVNGVAAQIRPAAAGTGSGCELTLTVLNSRQGATLFLLDGDTYVVDSALINPGDPVTVFYDGDAPAPLIYPPQYRAVAAARTDHYQYYLGEFSDRLLSADGTIRLDGDSYLPLFLPNGQPFYGSLAGKTALVEYDRATKSIPALVNPIRVFVFCYR